jgi:hypothetical protein
MGSKGGAGLKLAPVGEHLSVSQPVLGPLGIANIPMEESAARMKVFDAGLTT